MNFITPFNTVNTVIAKHEQLKPNAIFSNKKKKKKNFSSYLFFMDSIKTTSPPIIFAIGLIPTNIKKCMCYCKDDEFIVVLTSINKIFHLTY